MTIDPRLDFSRRVEPDPDADQRTLLIAWLDYQRGEFGRKLRDLDDEGLVDFAVPPLELSVLGLVRHLRQMEHVYLSWGLGGGEREPPYGADDFAGGDATTVRRDVSAWLDEIDAADRAIAAIGALDQRGLGHGRPLGATLVKMIDEYALHAGQAHVIRFAALGELLR